MDTFQQRMREAAEIVGGQSELARKASALAGHEIKAATVQYLCNDKPKEGKKPAQGSRFVSYFATAAGLHTLWLTKGIEPKWVGAPREPKKKTKETAVDLGGALSDAPTRSGYLNSGTGTAVLNEVREAKVHEGGDSVYSTNALTQEQLIRIGSMTSDQEIVAIVELWRKIPETARAKYMQMILQDALKSNWIAEIPGSMLADWSAREKIAALNKKSGSGTN